MPQVSNDENVLWERSERSSSENVVEEYNPVMMTSEGLASMPDCGWYNWPRDLHI